MVIWAWKVIYRKFPCVYELCSIFTHDLGYWGLAKMDDEQGQKHPEIMSDWWNLHGNRINNRMSGFHYRVADEILGHSGFYAERYGTDLSKLYKADKLAIVLCPKWLYLLLANLSGEIHEYMEIARSNKDGKYLNTATQTRWLLGLHACMIMKVFDTPAESINVKQYTVADVECESCGWGGSYGELMTFPQSDREICAICGAPDSIIELDAVGEDDYRKQEVREKIE